MKFTHDKRCRYISAGSFENTTGIGLMLVATEESSEWWRRRVPQSVGMSWLLTTVYCWNTAIDFTGTYILFEKGHAAEVDMVGFYLRRCDRQEGNVSIDDRIG